MSDLIKREDAIANIEMLLDDISDIQNEDELKEIKAYNLGVWASLNSIKHHVPSADRPQGEWIDKGRNLWGCSNCGMEIYSESERDRNEFHKWCSRCGAKMKGADDE